MLDSFDYKEPKCALCGGKEFYYPNENDAIGHIPVNRIIEKLDSCFEKNDLGEAKRLLEYWQKEAVSLKDLQGELSVCSELVGLYRKTMEREQALIVIDRALQLLDMLDLIGSVSGATILLNCATTLKAFGQAEKSIPLYKQVEKVYNERLNANDELFGGLYNNMALALVDLKEYDSAIDCYNKALKVMKEKENGKLESAITYINMAHMFDEIGKSQQASDSIEKSLLLLTDDSILKNGYCAFVFEKCIPSLKYFGKEEIATQLEKEVKIIYERA